jgi:hypothetical protein
MYVYVHHTPTLTFHRLETTHPSAKATTGMAHDGPILVLAPLREDALFRNHNPLHSRMSSYHQRLVSILPEIQALQ